MTISTMKKFVNKVSIFSFSPRRTPGEKRSVSYYTNHNIQQQQQHQSIISQQLANVFWRVSLSSFLPPAQRRRLYHVQSQNIQVSLVCFILVLFSKRWKRKWCGYCPTPANLWCYLVPLPKTLVVQSNHMVTQLFCGKFGRGGHRLCHVIVHHYFRFTTSISDGNVRKRREQGLARRASHDAIKSTRQSNDGIHHVHGISPRGTMAVCIFAWIYRTQ